MAGFLLDENLPPRLAYGFQLLGFDVYAIGRGVAPPKGSGDAEVVAWCVASQCVLVTRDRGRKNREMIDLIQASAVSVLMLSRNMTNVEFVRQFVRRYDVMSDDFQRGLARRRAYRRRMSPGGRLEFL